MFEDSMKKSNASNQSCSTIFIVVGLCNYRRSLFTAGGDVWSGCSDAYNKHVQLCNDDQLCLKQQKKMSHCGARPRNCSTVQLIE